MKTQLYNTDGKSVKQIELPKCFSEMIRDDLVWKIVEAKRIAQPYGPGAESGRHHSASGLMIHRRHVWKSGYGKGQSRIPRKVMSNKGNQFNLVAAEVPNTRGGRRAHGPEILSRTAELKINKKELTLALKSALSATAKPEQVSKKYQTLSNQKISGVPFVVESEFLKLKTKKLLEAMKKILGESIYNVAIKTKAVRSGKGKMRGRRYKQNAGALIVVGNKENLKTGAFDFAKAQNVGIMDLANGGQGRLVIYTEEAIKNLGEKFK
jgi:large subunit ribosomal protein L4e